jgi:hypothetical protein
VRFVTLAVMEHLTEYSAVNRRARILLPERLMLASSRLARRSLAALLMLSAALAPGIAASSARVTTAPLPAGAITAFRLHDSGSGAGRAVTFGLPLARDALDNSRGLVVTNSSGQVLTSQWNPLASWRGSSATLHGAMTFLTSSAGDNDGIYYVSLGNPSTGTPIAKSDVVASGFDADVEVTLAGGVYRLSAKDLLSGAARPRMDYTHFTGPLASEFAIGGPLLLDGTGAAHDTLQAYFYVRAVKRPVERVYVTVVLENTGAFNALTDIATTSVDARVGGASLAGFPKPEFTVYADIRYAKRAWWNGSADLWVQHDLAYVSATNLMPTYRAVKMSSSTLRGYPQASEWNQRRILSSSMLEGGGAKPELAPHDSWTAAYMVSGDRRAWNAMRTAVDEYAMMVSNHSRGVVHARDERTGFPLDLAVKGVVGRIWFDSGGTDVLNATRQGNPVAQTDIAHWPSIAYLTYLLSAESNEMENVQHSAVQTWLNEAPGGAKGTIPGRRLEYLQTRGMAWALREIVNGAVVTPDHHPLRNALQTSATYVLNQYSAVGQAQDPQKATGLWFVTDYAFPHEGGTHVALWMNDYLTWAVGDAYERGWKAELDANGFWAWKARAVTGRFGTTPTNAYCWNEAARYNVRARPTTSSPVYPTWGLIFAANLPGVTGCAATGSTDAGDDANATDYGAQISGALSAAVSTGMPGAAAAWNLYEQRRRKWSFGFEQSPEWAITPRTSVAKPTDSSAR